MTENYLDQLNESQRAAVTYTEGPSLVIAGAGSGKTRVLTCKIAYLLRQGVHPNTILALTFTNKAAREMKERIAAMVGEEMARRLWMGTFHSVFSRILRFEAEHTGYPAHFTIYDASDSKNLLKAIIKEMQLDDKVYIPGMVQSRISHAKNALVTCGMYAQSKEWTEYDMKTRTPLLRDIYTQYQNRCRQAEAMDFDDLLLQTNLLFRNHPDVLEKYRGFFQHILVDEYQDTNYAQHLIVQHLSEKHGRITVVGDDAQSIYSFRGADINNILQLKDTYPDCRIFKLERNYRSTQNIVNAANSLIHKNEKQIHKTIYSENEEGGKLQVLVSLTDYEEAYNIAYGIEGMRRRKEEQAYAGFAVLYRTNAQSRILEETLRKRGIPYRIYGGMSFYQRKEIKDVIAYFRMVVNPHDEEALKRIINYPLRGIGDTTVGKLAEAASRHAVSLWSALKEPPVYGVTVNSGTAGRLREFHAMIASFITFSREHPAEEAAIHIIKQSGIYASLMQDQSVEGVGKRENIDELLKGITDFVRMRREEGSEEVSIADFLSEVALFTDQDNTAKGEQTDCVTLMTVHSAKGLEFRTVFISGLEEDLFPSSMSRDSLRAIEEERRLFYVAITRAQENCFLSYAKSRFRNGKTSICTPSRFLNDIDRRYLSLFQHGGAENTEKKEYKTERDRQSLRVLNPPCLRVENNKDIPGLHTGCRVRHDRFGEGEVIAIKEEGTQATIRFSLLGEKNLLLKFAKLTILP
jgi:DNA helicase-2/ATP-dependent DNA helicase PcrA